MRIKARKIKFIVLVFPYFDKKSGDVFKECLCVQVPVCVLIGSWVDEKEYLNTFPSSSFK